MGTTEISIIYNFIITKELEPAAHVKPLNVSLIKHSASLSHKLLSLEF